MNFLHSRMDCLHFIGIGGIGMSGIAEMMRMQEFEISGSDLRESEITRHLRKIGCRIHIGHSPENIGCAKAVVYSSAVKMDNPEIVEARRQKIPVIRRAEMMAEIMRTGLSITIGGTHGKTTTTSLTGDIFTKANFDPTVIVGGVMRGLGTNARLGKGEIIITEADEYDRSFLKFSPYIAAITTCDREHMDTYHTFENLQNAFISFANSVPFYGLVILCIDDDNLVAMMPRIERPIVTYGLAPQADFHAKHEPGRGLNSFRVFHKEEELGIVDLPLLGDHNLRNGLAAIAIAYELKVPFETIQDALGTFQGVKRRFEKRGEVADIEIYDDYAHHPTEIKVTLEAIKNAYSSRIVAVFQPHLYSRTSEFYHEFARVLLNTDVLVIAPIYPARESPIPGVTSKIIAEKAREYGHRSVHLMESRKEIAPFLVREILKPGDLVVTLGAGDISETSTELLELLEDRERSENE